MRILPVLLLLAACPSADEGVETETDTDTDDTDPSGSDDCIEPCADGVCAMTLELPTEVAGGMVTYKTDLPEDMRLTARPAGCDTCPPLRIQPDASNRVTLATYGEDRWDLALEWGANNRVELAKDWNATLPFPAAADLVDAIVAPPLATPFAGWPVRVVGEGFSVDATHRYYIAPRGPARVEVPELGFELPFTIQSGALLDTELSTKQIPLSLTFDGPTPERWFPVYYRRVGETGEPPMTDWIRSDATTLSVPPAGPWEVSTDREMTAPTRIEGDGPLALTVPTVEVQVDLALDRTTHDKYFLDATVSLDDQGRATVVVPENTWRVVVHRQIPAAAGLVIERRVDAEHPVVDIGEDDYPLVGVDFGLLLSGPAPTTPFFLLGARSDSTWSGFGGALEDGAAAFDVPTGPYALDLSTNTGTAYLSLDLGVHDLLADGPLDVPLRFDQVTFDAKGGDPYQSQPISGVVYGDGGTITLTETGTQRVVPVPEGTWEVLLMSEATDGTTSIMQAPECIRVPEG